MPRPPAPLPIPPPPPTAPLPTYLRLQKANDAQILKLLRASEAQIAAELRRLDNLTSRTYSDRVKRFQVLQSQAQINRELRDMWEKIGDLQEKANAHAAAVAAENLLLQDKTWTNVFSKMDQDYILRSAAASAQQSVEVALERISGSSYVPLSESVYKNADLSAGRVDDVINNALARGASAVELARDVRSYIDPNVRGGVSYAAMRLGRTELNNAFHASQVRQARETPWITGLQWHLSGSHPRPDECNEYAQNVQYPGSAPGVWMPGDVPAKPHPNCLCFTTPVSMKEDEFIDRYLKGDFDKFLEEVPELDSPSALRSLTSSEPPKPVPSRPSSSDGRSAVKADDAVKAEAKRQTDEAYRRVTRTKSASGELPIETAMKANPTRNRINCQKVVSTYEMRRRGYMVAARPDYGFSDYREIARHWKNVDGSPTSMTHLGNTTELTNHLMSQPVGSRHGLSVLWEGNRSAHIFTVERTKDGIRYLDAQTGDADAAFKLARVSKDSSGTQWEAPMAIFRMDDKVPSDYLKNWMTYRDAETGELVNGTEAQMKAEAKKRLSRGRDAERKWLEEQDRASGEKS